MSDTVRHDLSIKYYENHLTKKPCYKAQVSLRGTLTNEDIARRIVARRSGYIYETILLILNLSDQEKIEALADGYAVVDGAYHAAPSVTGKFNVPGTRFEAREHTVGATVKPSPDLRRTMKECKVKVQGRAVVGPVVIMVEDIVSKTKDMYVTPGGVMRIHGRWLKIVGDDPATGVYFVSAANPKVRIRVDDRGVIDNKPVKLLILVPELPAGKYFLEVATQFTNGSKLVKEARTYRLQYPLETNTR